MSDYPLVSLEALAVPSPNAMATGPFGSSIGAKTFRTSGIPVIRGSNLSADVGNRLIDENLVFIDEELAKQFKRSQVFANDLIFTCWGTINQVGIIDSRSKYSRYVISNKQMKFAPNMDLVLPLYLYYWFSSPAGQADIISGGIGSSVPGFNLGQLRKMRVPLPPIEVQKAIVSLLGALDDKIELNRRMNETLEAMARAIFKDWFVDFGPTQARMEGGAPYLAPQIWVLFPDRLNAVDVPEGWSLGTLEDVSALNSESWSRSTYPAHVDYVDLSNTKWGTIEAPERHDKETAPTRAQRVLRRGDTIVGTVRPGNGSFALVGENGLTGSTGFAVLRPRTAQFRELVYLAATSSLNIDRLSHLADGAAYPAVRPEIVHVTEMVRASDEIVEAFHRTTAPLIDKIEANKREVRTLAAARDLLLPKLISGEIHVKDAETAVGAAA